MTALRRLEFSAYCQTQYGQYVCLCGNIPQLGNWNPMKGLRLYTEQSFYPIWKSFNSILVIENQPIQFKIVVVTSKLQFKWQKIFQNRIIVPQIDAYVKITANQFQMYEIFPFCDRQQGVRTGIDILNDLSSDGSSSISFKSNYRFYEYYDHKKSLNGSIIPLNTSTFRDLGYLQGERSIARTESEFMTYIDSLMQLQPSKVLKDSTTQDCSIKKFQEQVSHSTNSDKEDQEEEQMNRDDWIVYCGGGTENICKAGKQKYSNKKNNCQSPHVRLTSLNKIVHSNSSQSLSFGRDQ